MNKKLLFCAILFAVATLSPAPIVDKSGFKHTLRDHGAQEKLEDQKFNGTAPVLGIVPEHTNQDGTGPAPLESSKTAAANLAVSSPEMAQKAVRNLTVAEQNLKLDHQGEPMNPILLLLLIALGVGGAGYGLKYCLDKFGPAPKSFRPAERIID